MFKNRFILVLGVLSLLLVTMAVSYPRTAAPLAADQEASDIFQRHPEWRSNVQNAVVPVTGANDFSDYYQRHPELKVPAAIAVDTSDYFMRHSELRVPAKSIDLSDYFLRHPELRSK
jgi:hypothetical protein